MKNQGPPKLLTLYPYQSENRDCITRIKIDRCRRSLLYFTQKCLDHPKLEKFLVDVEYIVPAPSSLYSRINGKFDLAHWASLEIAATYNISLKMAPKNSFWRFRKRSQIKNRRKNHTHLTDFLGNKRPNRTEARQCDAGGQIILLDDVITTGFTFEQLILSTGIPQEKIKLLALCDAR
jgi:predicted amidophosphoribosyltransferase